MAEFATLSRFQIVESVLLESHPLKLLKNLRRTGEIAAVLINHGFGDLVERIGLNRYLNWGRRKLLKQSDVHTRSLTRAERLRMSCESLGPTFVKFGQVLSTRPDLIPGDIVDELAKLQEHVAPFPSEIAIQTIEKALKKPIRELFSRFESEPLATGSLGQVHTACLPDGSDVIIKVRRPRAIQDVERDLSLIQELAHLISKRVPESQVFDPTGLVRNFERTIRREMDYLREARSIDEFARMFADDAALYVPKVYPHLCTEDVLVMERIEGHRVDDLPSFPKLWEKRKQIAANGARIFLRQAFEFGLFHGDPHPGNFRILDNGSICLLDFGMIGTLDEQTREHLVDLFISTARKDVRGSLRNMKLICHIPRDIEERYFYSDYRDFIDKYYGLPLEQLDLARLLRDFIDLLSRHRIRCPGDLMLLIKVIVHLEAVGRKIDPDFNLVEVAIPHFRKLIRDRYHPQYLWERFREEVLVLGQAAHDIPVELSTALKRFNRDDSAVKLKLTGLEYMVNEIDRCSNRIVIGVIVAAAILSSSILVRSDATNDWFSLPIYLISSLLGIWLIYGIFRSGRL
ncbi:MAG: AarF/ABC1/UbiB kinase family protein [Planctomycetaceae bacterium]|nr:AarF/ABC1/UbiB kinase family protein [Planctomycetaceae bacterium]